MKNPLSRVIARKAARDAAAKLLTVEEFLNEARVKLMEATNDLPPDDSRLADLERRVEAAWERIEAAETEGEKRLNAMTKNISDLWRTISLVDEAMKKRFALQEELILERGEPVVGLKVTGPDGEELPNG